MDFQEVATTYVSVLACMDPGGAQGEWMESAGEATGLLACRTSKDLTRSGNLSNMQRREIEKF